MIGLSAAPQKIDPQFLLDPFEPAYLALSSAKIEERVEAGLRELISRILRVKSG